MTTLTRPSGRGISGLRNLPADYEERVYAGVLGKMIGVYLGRPFEGWSHDRILKELGEVDHYVHDKLGQQLVVTDDDIAGTFTFLRALEDAGYDPDLSPADIGRAWLNYLIEKRTILWWGGLGMSTEHTAYLRLKHGISAPQSGSIETNGQTIAEQIGSQIFIDGWAMLFPGDPEAAVDFARRAASVSHDGEAIYGAQVVAAIEAMAFVESDINKLLDSAVDLIPGDSTIAALIHDVRTWHAQDASWYDTLHRIQEKYGYDKYRGNCHMVPNHALIILALLHGDSDFRKSMMIVNTAGWDTDCNAGNVGAILGIKDGLKTLDTSSYDWRGPVADRMYMSTAEGGRSITDAVQESFRVVNAGRALHGQEPVAPKGGARFHFSLPGSTQGFQADDATTLTVGNDAGRLALTLGSAGTATATTPVFIPEEARVMRGYYLYASPTLHPGQTVTATFAASDARMDASVVIRVYGAADAIEEIPGPTVSLVPGKSSSIEWTIPELKSRPIVSLGFRLSGSEGATALVESIDWKGAPTTTFSLPANDNTMWQRAWVDGVQEWSGHWNTKPFTISQNEGTGLISQGTEDWTNYEVSADVTIPLGSSAGLAARVGGMRRYLALVIDDDGFARLVRTNHDRIVLAEKPFRLDPDRVYSLRLTVSGSNIRGEIDGQVVLEATDETCIGGAAGLVVTEGTIVSSAITVCAL